MPAYHWTREQIQGKEILWLVSLDIGGRIVRVASQETDITSSELGALSFAGTLVELAYRASVDLFSDGIDPATAEVELLLPPDVDLIDLLGHGHDLGGAWCEVAQWVDGLAWEDRVVVVTGRVSNPEHGANEDPVRFSVVAEVYADRGVIPSTTLAVDESTWVVDHRLSANDLGVPYPLIFGYPGRSSRALSGWVSAALLPFASKALYGHKLVVGAGKMECAGTTIWINHDGDTRGKEVEVDVATDLRGQSLCIVDYNLHNYDYSSPGMGSGHPEFLGADFAPAYTEDVSIFAGFPNGGGIVGGDGEVIRNPMDVAAYVLGFSTMQVDIQAFKAAAPLLSGINIDCVIDAGCQPWEWCASQLLPLLPVSILAGPRGVYPVVWRHNATEADAVATIDADRDLSIEVAHRVEYDNSHILNEFALHFGLSRRTGEHLYTARLGASYSAPTGYARNELASTGSNPQRIVVRARTSGASGAGIRVTLTDTGVLGLTDNATTNSVAITFDGGVTTTAALVTRIQTSTLITCTDDDTATIWGGTTTASVILALEDTGTRAAPICASSQRRYTNSDGTGVFPDEMSTALLYDDASADAVNAWRAAAFALAWRFVEMTAPDSEHGWLRLGDVVQFTYGALGFSRTIAHVVGIEWMDDGLIGLRLAVIGDPARDTWA